MNVHSILAGEVATLSQELDGDADPLPLYAALSDLGTRANTMLFEQADALALILDLAALKITCRGETVLLEPLTANGQRLVSILGQRFHAHPDVDADGAVTLKFPRFEGDDCDERLNAPSSFDVLRAVTGLTQNKEAERFSPACLGIIAFDHVDLFERLPASTQDPLGFTDFVFFVPESLIVFEYGRKPRAIVPIFGPDDCASDLARTRLGDLVAQCSDIPALPAVEPIPGPASEVEFDIDDRCFANMVTAMKDRIAVGEISQIVISRTFNTPCPKPFEAFRRLRAVESSPYSFFVALEDLHLFGASPETSVRVYRDEHGLNVELKPIAGTRPRGLNADEDDRLEAELRLDLKEQAEHMMLVDLARNDVARIAVSGTRRVTELMSVERYAKVMHLVSRVTGRLRDRFDTVHALKACLNMGTLTGAPKVRATELIRHVEGTKRGPYGGAIGWLAADGTMDSAIVIRTAIVRDGMAYVRAGAGIVADSEPRAEADETRRKASALLSAIAGDAT